MGLSLPHLLLLLLVILLVFGAGRLPRVMNDIGKGIRSLRDGLKNDEEELSKQAPPPPAPGPTVIDHEPVRSQTHVTDKDKV